MTPIEAHQEALRRIEHARVTKATVLDLSKLPLEMLPEELGKLTDLRTLGLGGFAPRVDSGEEIWDSGDYVAFYAAELASMFFGGPSKSFPRFDHLGVLSRLRDLQHLCLSGCVLVSDLSPLCELSGLRSLILKACRCVSDLSP